MKKVVLPSAVILFFGLASAQSSYNYNSGSSKFSLSDFLSTIDSSMIFLGAILIITFSIVFFSLSKMLKTKEKNVAIPAVVAFAISFLTTYEINKMNLDYEHIFSGIGIPANILNIAIPVIIAGLSLFLIIKLKKHFLLVLGGALFIVSLTNLFYEKTILMIASLVILGIYVWLLTKSKKKKYFVEE